MDPDGGRFPASGPSGRKSCQVQNDPRRSPEGRSRRCVWLARAMATGSASYRSARRPRTAGVTAIARSERMSEGHAVHEYAHGGHVREDPTLDLLVEPLERVRRADRLAEHRRRQVRWTVRCAAPAPHDFRAMPSGSLDTAGGRVDAPRRTLKEDANDQARSSRRDRCRVLGDRLLGGISRGRNLPRAGDTGQSPGWCGDRCLRRSCVRGHRATGSPSGVGEPVAVRIAIRRRASPPPSLGGSTGSTRSGASPA